MVAATKFGPRLISLKRDDSPEILVELPPGLGIHNPGVGTFRFRGGHRLWASPERPEITHVPDDHSCLVTVDVDKLTISGPVDAAGFEKELQLSWDGTGLTVDHLLRWSGDEPITAGAWAITQLPPGGVAVLPLSGDDRGPPLEADASLALWPYTRLDDPRLSWGERTVLIRAVPGRRLKLGSGPAPGGLGYLKDGYLFIKRFRSARGEVYPDRGAVGQVYVNGDFCELESVGALARLEPGAGARHRETWEVTECADLDFAVASAADWGVS